MSQLHGCTESRQSCIEFDKSGDLCKSYTSGREFKHGAVDNLIQKPSSTMSNAGYSSEPTTEMALDASNKPIISENNVKLSQDAVKSTKRFPDITGERLQFFKGTFLENQCGQRSRMQ